MAKHGIMNDYDLMANAEDSAKAQRCACCDAEPMTFQWSDYSGQAMCTKCGTPYQLKWGTDKQVAEGKYPYLSIRDDFVPVYREYFAQTGRWTCLGLMLGPRPGMDELVEWLSVNHPEWIRPQDAQAR